MGLTPRTAASSIVATEQCEFSKTPPTDDRALSQAVTSVSVNEFVPSKLPTFSRAEIAEKRHDLASTQRF